MVDEKNASDWVKEMRRVLDTLSVIVRKYDDSRGSDYLRSFFNEDNDAFCRFVGFARVEMQTTKHKKDVVVNIWKEIAMAGISMGRMRGYADAKRIYSAA